MSLLAAAGCSFLVSLVYLFNWNPEVRFFEKAAKIKQAWADKMTREHGMKMVVYGGSSCAFSIDGERLLEKHGIPAVNMGLHAGFRPTMLTNWALSETRPGDTLVVAIEPGLLSGPQGSLPFAIQFSYAMGSPAWLNGPWLEHPVSLASSLFALRPSGYHVFIMLGKLMKGMPLYRYAPSDIHASGWLTTSDRRSIENASGKGGDLRLSSEAVGLLQWLRNWSEVHHVRLAYSLPWVYAAPESVASCQRNNLVFLQQVAQFLPVLKDAGLGVFSERLYFADTPLHLSPEGAALRTDSLAKQLKAWDVWTPDQLQALLAEAPSVQTNPHLMPPAKTR